MGYHINEKNLFYTVLLWNYPWYSHDNFSHVLQKDGFVTPATPDIPKASCHYSQGRGPKDLDERGDGGEFSESVLPNTDNLFTEQESKCDCYSRVGHF